MSKFEVGQRVHVYCAQIYSYGGGGGTGQFWGPFAAEVLATDCVYGTQKGFLRVKDPYGVDRYAHPKQCRRLVRKKPSPPAKGERLAEEYADRAQPEADAWTAKRRDFLAGFQARAPLVELLREALPVLRGERHRDINELAARIDAALKGET